MAKPLGSPKIGGRVKGTPNKKTTEVVEKAKSFGITPLEFMLQMLNDPSNPNDVRASAARDAAPYVHSKMPTALQISGSLEMIHEVALNELE